MCVRKPTTRDVCPGRPFASREQRGRAGSGDSPLERSRGRPARRERGLPREGACFPLEAPVLSSPPSSDQRAASQEGAERPRLSPASRARHTTETHAAPRAPRLGGSRGDPAPGPSGADPGRTSRRLASPAAARPPGGPEGAPSLRGLLRRHPKPRPGPQGPVPGLDRVPKGTSGLSALYQAPPGLLASKVPFADAFPKTPSAPPVASFY